MLSLVWFLYATPHIIWQSGSSETFFQVNGLSRATRWICAVISPCCPCSRWSGPKTSCWSSNMFKKKVLRGVWVWVVLHSLFYLAPDLLGHDLWKVTSLWTVTLSTYRWLFQEWFLRNASGLNSFWEQHKELPLSLVGRSSRPNLRIWTCFIFLIHLNTHLHCLLPSDLMYFGKSIRWDRETEIKKKPRS